MARINMDFMHEVCYRGMFDLDKAVHEGKPAGLKTLGDWKTLYEGLSSLTPQARESWLAFDHYYSDAAFPAALPLVFADHPKRLLDVAEYRKMGCPVREIRSGHADHHCRSVATTGACQENDP